MCGRGTFAWIKSMDLHCCPFHILWLLAGNASRDGCTCLGTATPAVWIGGGEGDYCKGRTPATPAVWIGGGGRVIIVKEGLLQHLQCGLGGGEGDYWKGRTPNKKMLLKHVANSNHSKLLSTPCLAHRTCVYVYVCVLL